MFLFGTTVEAEIDKATKNVKDARQSERKAEDVLKSYLRDYSAPRKFRDPAAGVKRKG